MMEDFIGRSVVIELTYLHYDGALTAKAKLTGRLLHIDATAAAVELDAPANEECWLLPDSKCFKEDGAGTLRVRVGSVGIPYRRDLRRCIYLD